MKTTHNMASHNLALDGLRFISFLAVYFYHCGMFPPGSLGVTVFFVLSGFLIGRILVRQRDTGEPLGKRLRRFYLRRSLRIFPVYYLVLGTLAFVGLRQHANYHGIYGASALYLTNWFMAANPYDPASEAGHFWTLAIEEQFYLIVPFALLTVPMRRLEWGVATFWAGCALLVGTNWLCWQYAGLRFFSPVQFCFLGLGIAAAICSVRGRFLSWDARSFDRASIVAGAGLIVGCVPSIYGRFGEHYCEFYAALTAIAAAGLVLKLWEGGGGLVARVLTFRPLAFFGRVSYGAYIFHILVLDHFPSDHQHHRAISSLVITLALASLSWTLFEGPINRLKDRWAPAAHPGKPTGTTCTGPTENQVPFERAISLNRIA